MTQRDENPFLAVIPLRKPGYQPGVAVTYEEKDFLPALLMYLPFLLLYYTSPHRYIHVWWHLLYPYIPSCFVRVMCANNNFHLNPILWPDSRVYYREYDAWKSVVRKTKWCIVFLVILLSIGTYFIWHTHIMHQATLDSHIIYHPAFPGEPLYMCCHTMLLLAPPSLMMPCIVVDKNTDFYRNFAPEVPEKQKQQQRHTTSVPFTTIKPFFRDAHKVLYYGFTVAGTPQPLYKLVESNHLQEKLASSKGHCQCPPMLGIMERDLYFHYNEVTGEWLVMHSPRIYLNSTLSGLVNSKVASFHEGFPAQENLHYASFYVTYYMVEPIEWQVKKEEEDAWHRTKRMATQLDEYMKELRGASSEKKKNAVIMAYAGDINATSMVKRKHLFSGESAVCFVYCQKLFDRHS